MSAVGFLICVERGRLEHEGRLLLESLRRFGGSLAEAPAYVFAPRPRFRPPEPTFEALRELGADWVEEPLVPERFAEIPTCNKVFACAWAERELPHERLVFTDTDTVFLSEPAELTAGAWLAAMRPVDRRIAGSRGKGKNEPFWRKMYAELGVKQRPFVETAVGQVPIRAYWNTGLLAVHRDAGLFGAWQRALERLFEAGIVQKRWPQFMDQLSWAGVTADLHERVQVLPPTYNYPLRHRQALAPAARELDLAEIVHLHYRLWFHVPGALEKANPPFSSRSEQYAWLAERLPIEPLVEGTDGDL